MSIPLSRPARRWMAVLLTMGVLGLAGLIWAIREKPRANPSLSSRSLEGVTALREKPAAQANANGPDPAGTLPAPRLATAGVPADSGEAGCLDRSLLEKKAHIQAAREALIRKEGWSGSSLGERVRRLRVPVMTPSSPPQ